MVVADTVHSVVFNVRLAPTIMLSGEIGVSVITNVTHC